MFTSYNFPKLENCIDKQLSQIENISLVGDRALRATWPAGCRAAAASTDLGTRPWCHIRASPRIPRPLPVRKKKRHIKYFDTYIKY